MWILGSEPFAGPVLIGLNTIEYNFFYDVERGSQTNSLCRSHLKTKEKLKQY